MKSTDMSSVLLSACEHLNFVMFQFYKILTKTKGGIMLKTNKQNPPKNKLIAEPIAAFMGCSL